MNYQHLFIYNTLNDIFSNNNKFLHILTNKWISDLVAKTRKFNIVIDKNGIEEDIWWNFGSEPFSITQDESTKTVEFFIFPSYDEMKDLPARRLENFTFEPIQKGLHYWIASVAFGPNFERYSYLLETKEAALNKLFLLVKTHAPESENYKSYDVSTDSFSKNDLLNKIQALNFSAEANLYTDNFSFSVDFWYITT